MRTPAAYRAEAALGAVRRLVPHEYARLSSMGHPAWRHFEVLGLTFLAPTYVIPHPAPRYRSLARRLCGARVADWSWAVQLDFPECQIPCSEDVALLTLTRGGWRIWYSEFRRP
jgi:hypothetical protein